MFGAVRASLLSTLLLAGAIAPIGALASLQHWNALDKRQEPATGSECYRDFATDPENCPILNVAFFEDSSCSKPLQLAHAKPDSFIEGNKQMLFDAASAHTLKSPFGSVRILAAAQGVGLGFAKEEESDTIVQNFAFMSSADTFKAYQSKSCVTFPNLDASKVGIWTVRSESSLNQEGYVWNPDNIPLKQSAPQCTKRTKRASTQPGEQCVCLEGASWGGGGVLQLYSGSDCTGETKRQLYSTAQCTPISMTGFNSFKAVQPLGPTIDAIFSPVYYGLDKDQYHRCSQRDVTAKPFKSGVCQQFKNSQAFVGVYGNDPDPSLAQPPPGPADKVLLKGKGGLLLSPAPHPGRPAHHQ